MHPSLDLRIREHVADYLAQRTALPEFLDWFMDAAEDAYETKDADLILLVDTIKLYWAELTSGDLSEREFRDSLAPLASTYVVPFRTPDAPELPEIRLRSAQDCVETEPLAWSASDVISSGAIDVMLPPEFDTQAESHSAPLRLVDDSQRNTRKELVFNR